MPKKPCCTGWRVSAQAWAMEPVPRPASLEKMPRATPFCRLKKQLPTTPPVTAAGLNAPWKIQLKTCGTACQCATITPMASKIYSSAIKGTSFSVTEPILLMPPSSTKATKTLISTPNARLNLLSSCSLLIKPKLSRAESTAATMVLVCVALPVPKTASTPKRENRTASHCQFLLRPFLM